MASLDPPTGDKPISILRTMTSPVANASARPSAVSPLRQRPLARANTIAEGSGTPNSAGLGRRRSSFMTDASARSGTESLFLPRVSRDAPDTEDLSDGSSHLHSLPLALALLPAIGGVFFNNGSAVLTDVTLLVLAAIFLNWSVRLPWDWYHSAQMVRVQEEADEEVVEEDGYFPPHAETIVEEGSQDGKDDDSAEHRSPISPQRPSPVMKEIEANKGKIRANKKASLELRIHELVALIACFACPVLGAWLLHHIRGSLSRPSEGLVSDYNLSIFLLASELRPLSHLLRMIQSRTLHLQRVVAANPYTTASPAANREAVKDLQTRVDELEAHIASQAAEGKQAGSQAVMSTEKERDLTRSIEGTLRAALQPELDAVTRATRRYEKRATLLGMQTEARLNALEQRVQDAVALAAGAERAQQARSSRSGFGQLLDAAVLGLTAAFDLLLWLVTRPLRGAEWLLATAGRWAAWLLDATLGRVLNVRLSSRPRDRSRSRADVKGKRRADRASKSAAEDWSSGGKKERKAARAAGATATATRKE